MNERDRTLLQQIGRTSRAMYAAFEAEVGHPLPSWRILHAIHERGCVTQKQLVGELAMDPGALTRQMKALEHQGLVTRRSAQEDNRLTAVALTPAGRKAVEAIQPMRRTFLQKALRGLPQEQLEVVIALLQDLEGRFRRMTAARRQ